MKVLIADDDPVSLLVLDELLTGFEYQVVSCKDGIEAWDALSSEDAPELAILDWMMPGLDGLELCKRLRESSHPSLPYILLLTVKRRKEDMIQALQAGADDFLTKPVDPEEIHARLRVGQRIVDLQRRRVEEETRYYVEQLEQTVEELHTSRARIVDAQEEIRRAIAEELHGNVQTKLTILSMKLMDLSTRAGSEELQQELLEMSDEADRLREDDVRMLSHRLHPSIIRLGLCSGIRSIRDQYESTLPIEVDISGDVAALEAAGASRLPMNVRLGLYRVAEEAVGNAIKHAQANEVAMRLWLQDGGSKLGMSVEDDGVGFDLSSIVNKRSLGVVTIQDYMGAIGGEFSLESEPGVGTKVIALVPIDIENDLA